MVGADSRGFGIVLKVTDSEVSVESIVEVDSDETDGPLMDEVAESDELLTPELTLGDAATSGLGDGMIDSIDPFEVTDALESEGIDEGITSDGVTVSVSGENWGEEVSPATSLVSDDVAIVLDASTVTVVVPAALMFTSSEDILDCTTVLVVI